MSSLPVQYQSQWDRNLTNADCVVAASLMTIWYITGVRYVLRDLALQTNLARGSRGLSLAQGAALMAKYSVYQRPGTLTSLDQLDGELNAGRPVMVILRYGNISERMDKSDVNGGHCVVIVGHENGKVLINDPDFPVSTGQNKGDHLAIGEGELMAGISYYGGKALFQLPSTVVDLSHYDKQVDFSALKASGVEGVIFKGTQGSKPNQIDPTVLERLPAAILAKLLAALYHFIDGSDPLAQVEHLLALLATLGVNLPIWLDWELDPDTNQVADQGIVEKMVYILHDRLGFWPGLYTQKWFVARRSSIISNCPLWGSAYECAEPALPYGFNQWALWQHTSGYQGPYPRITAGVGHADRSFVNPLVVPDLAVAWARNLNPITPTTKTLTTTTALRLRSGPGVIFNTITVYSPGTELFWSGRQVAGFYEIVAPQRGYVSAQYVA